MDASVSSIISNKKGLHARAAAQIVSLTSTFQSVITVRHNEKEVSSLSLIKLLTLDAPKGSRLIISANGQDCKEAIQAVDQLISQGFGE
jgi:phosphotransferase system HPr (HPr) family protein